MFFIHNVSVTFNFTNRNNFVYYAQLPSNDWIIIAIVNTLRSWEILSALRHIALVLNFIQFRPALHVQFKEGNIN